MSNTSTINYLPGTHPDWPPPTSTTGPIAWVRINLFSSPLNVFLTLMTLWLLWKIIPPFFEWSVLNSILTADSRKECWDQMSTPGVGACWAFISHRLFIFCPARFCISSNTL
jgi:general L-amino acid transport system permease protein